MGDVCRMGLRVYRHAQRGTSLVEIMVALVLGLAVLAGAFSSFVSNRAAFQQIEGMARLHETAHVAASLLESDIRQAGGSLCRRNLPLTNVVNSDAWWAQPATGIEGFDAASTDNRAMRSGEADGQEGTNSITVWSANALPRTQVTSVPANTTDSTSNTFGVDTSGRLNEGDLAVICDYNRAALFQVSSKTAQQITISAGGSNPGNCSAVLGAKVATDSLRCSTLNAETRDAYTFGRGVELGQLSAHHWYIGPKSASVAGSLNNMALRRMSRTSGNSATSEEILENVSDMQITYLMGDADGYPSTGTYVAATNINDWTRVIALRIVLTIRSTEAIALDELGNSSAASIQVPLYVTLRNRLPNRAIYQ